MFEAMGNAFTSSPGLALLPALGFAVVWYVTGRWLVLAAALSWAAYAAYETAMLMRILCSGECDIRIDLLAIYPALLALTFIAAIVAVAGLAGVRRGR
jgi:hypothetical protein